MRKVLYKPDPVADDWPVSLMTVHQAATPEDVHIVEGTAQPSRSRRKDVAIVIIVVGLMVALNLLTHLTILSSWLFTVPCGVGIILLVARAMGITWSDIGLSPATMKKGLAYGAVAAGVVAVLVLVGLLIPFTRSLFLDEGYASARKALLAAFVLIPIQTVLPEEFAFRGVLHGSLQRLGGLRATFVAGSGLFGLWHILSSLGLTSENAGLTAILGTGVAGQVAGIGLAVIATSFAGVGFTWLRARSGSIIAPVALHWALNGCGALAAAAAFNAF